MKKPSKAWVVAVDMGYGHHRAAYPLRHLAYKKVITANNYKGIPKSDRRFWREGRRFYDFISRFKHVPFLGDPLFELFDKMQAIPKFYPRRDLSAPNFQLKEIYALVRKRRWGRDLIERLNKKPLPLVTTFFVPALMAEIFNYLGDIYCVICDADFSRNWVPLEPAKSRINYFAPCQRVVDRLKLYGVSPERIFLTGFPLPQENLGNSKLVVLNRDIGKRLYNLDPEKKYISRYKLTIERHLGAQNFPKDPGRPLTLTFAVGGAGAQREIGSEITKSLKRDILLGQVRIYLVAGIHKDIHIYYRKVLNECGLGEQLGKGIRIVFSPNKQTYFRKFNKTLRVTDVLWTKPSELCFYSALGLPIIMSPPIGSQEEFNQKWLLAIGAGTPQDDPKYTNEWLFDWVRSGWLAEAAMRGYLEAPRLGTYNIEKIISKEVEEIKEMKTILQY